MDDVKQLIDRSEDLQRAGDLRGALGAASDAYAAAHTAFGEMHTATAGALSNLAAVWHVAGQPANALTIINRAVAIFEALEKAVTPAYVHALLHRGVIEASVGDSTGAIATLQCALLFGRRTPDTGPVEVARIAHNLAGAYVIGAPRVEYRHYHARAKHLYRWALAAYRRSGEEVRLDMAAALNDLAFLQLRTGDTVDVLDRVREALEIRRAVLGPDHPEVADSHHDLASTLVHVGDYTAAERAFRRALEIKRAALGDLHPSVSLTLTQLALLYSVTDRHDAALAVIREAAAIGDDWIEQVFRAASEQQLMDAARLLREATWLYLAFARRHGAQEAIAWAAEVALRRQAISQHGMLLQRAAVVRDAQGPLRAIADEIARIDAELTRLHLSYDPATTPEEQAIVLANLRGTREGLQQTIAQTLAGAGVSLDLGSVDLARVRLALPPGASLVQFVHVTEKFPTTLPDHPSGFATASEYLALVITADPPGCEILNLGNATAIDEMIATYRVALGAGASRHEEQAEAADPALQAAGRMTRSVRDIVAAARLIAGNKHVQQPGEEEAAGDILRANLFDPLLPHLHGRQRLVVIPDGEVSRLPLSILPFGKGRRVIDDYEISYLASARDLLTSHVAPLSDGPPLVVADPDFDLTDGTASSPFPSYPWEPLPGARKEGLLVSRILGVDAVTGAAAVVARLKQMHAPRMLHIATHGCAWDFGVSGKAVHDLDPSNLTNPLLRSGLMLAGVNTWLTRGPTTDAAGYGILFAQDVAVMDLRGTALVVLSACETGLGHVFPGEGVFGLARAFAVAGAATLVTTLWQIPDETTCQLMTEFYQGLLDRGSGRSQALREAQLAVKRSHPDPFHWGAFVCEGDPRPISKVPSR